MQSVLGKKFIYIIFFFTFALFVLEGILLLFGISFTEDSFLHQSMMFLPLLGILAHSVRLFKFRYTLLFFTLSAGIGFISEYLGVHYGYIFGSSYTYLMPGARVLDVPLMVLAYWFVFIYTGFSVTNILISKFKKTYGLLTKSLLDAYIILSIDLFMEPMQVQRGSWIWQNTSGFYFGIPTGNFIGWFLVGLIVCLLFRFFTKSSSILNVYSQKFSSLGFVYKIPLYGYALIWISLFMYMISTQNYFIAVIGSVFMLPSAMLIL